MKNLILLLLLIPFAGVGQTLIHTDTVQFSNDTIFYRWYHEKFIDADNPYQLVSFITLTKELKLSDTSYFSKEKTYKRYLRAGDKLKNPYTGEEYGYFFVKNYIYTTGEDMKRTLSLYQLLNYHKRIFE